MPFFLREEKVNHKGTEVTEQGILKPSGFCPVPAARPKPQAPRLNSNQDPMAGGQPRRGGGRAKVEEAVLFAPRRGARGENQSGPNLGWVNGCEKRWRVVSFCGWKIIDPFCPPIALCMDEGPAP